jgi:3-oxoacyl-[acyl-carrier protein] reductase
MDLGIAGKGALVVGANGGIGSTVCRALVAEGIGRLALGVRSRAKGQSLADELRTDADVDLLVVECDLEDPAAPERAVQKAQALGDIDIVALCAGSYPNGGLWDVTDDDWERGMTSKLMGAARLMRGAIPAMMERGWGRVVIVGGMRGRAPSNAAVIGGVVNVGIASLVSAVTKEVAERGVTVNAVDPAHVMTPRWEKRIVAMAEEEGISHEEVVAKIRGSAPIKSMTPAEDVGSLIAYLASVRAGSITGSSILIDGGSYPGLY